MADYFSKDYISKVTKRKRFHYAKYVNYDRDRNISECLVCRKQLKSLSTGNIKRHYLKLHDRDLDTDADSKIRSFPLRKFCKFKPSMGITRSEFLTCCVALVALRNIPISLFDDEEYFKKLFAPFEEEYKMTLNSKNIKSFMDGAESELRNIICDEIRAKLVCLKYEVVTQGERGFLALNIQYVDDFKMVVQTIGVFEMVKNQDMDMQHIMKNLHECGLNDSRIYLSCSDICANIYVPELKRGDDSAKNDTEWNKEYEKMHSSITDVVKCPSQTLCFMAKSVIDDLADQIEKCRRIVFSLQSLSQKYPEIKMPPLDISTRWLSTFTMIDSLSKMKKIIDCIQRTFDIDWPFVMKFAEAFKPLSDCLEKLHEVNYIIGDFYRDCLCCEIELEELGSSNIYANILLKELRAAKAKLLENQAVLAALYVDQRFNFIKTPFLTEEQQCHALDHLMTTVGNLKQPTSKKQEECSSDEGERSMDVTIENDPFMKLEERTKSMIGSLTPTKEKTMKEKLDCLRFGERLSFHADILHHWKCLTHEDAEMKQLVEVVLGYPCTQSSMEMTMKELSNVLRNPDCNVLPNKTIANIFMTRLNGNILNFINLDGKTDDTGLM